MWKQVDIICYKLTSLGSLLQGNVKNLKNWLKLIKIANIDRKSLHNFWKTWGISMKFVGKTCLMIILKVTKNHGFTLSLEDTFFKKPQLGGQIKPLPPPLSAVLGLIITSYICTKHWSKFIEIFYQIRKSKHESML